MIPFLPLHAFLPLPRRPTALRGESISPLSPANTARRSTSTARKPSSDHFRRLDAALAGVDHLICYAVKANSNLAVLDLLNRERAGFDIVSAGELFRVLKAGGKPECCTFAGRRQDPT